MIKYLRLWNTPYIRSKYMPCVRGKSCHLHAIWKSQLNDTHFINRRDRASSRPCLDALAPQMLCILYIQRESSAPAPHRVSDRSSDESNISDDGSFGSFVHSLPSSDGEFSAFFFCMMNKNYVCHLLLATDELVIIKCKAILWNNLPNKRTISVTWYCVSLSSPVYNYMPSSLGCMRSASYVPYSIIGDKNVSK